MIETNRLRIFAASQDQMEKFVVMQTIDVLKVAYKEMLEGCLAHPNQWKWYAIWMIELKDGTHVGELCFKGLSEDGVAEIGYGIVDDYQGRGYATEAVAAIVRWALEQPDVKSVVAETEETNIASQNVLKKASFVPTGEIGDEGPIFVRRKMDIESYRKYMTADTLMGPNSARVLEELLCKHPLCLFDTDAILDLGCGTGLTSLILAEETGAKVYASDLWISADDNKKRFMKWGVGDQIIPFCEDANALNYEENQFSALVSVDAYHYFGARRNFFADKILPILRDKSTVLIGIPGIKDAYSGRAEELLGEWLGEEACTFQSPISWKEIIGSSDRIESVETWEMECFDLAWSEWLATENEFAAQDKKFFDTHIKSYSCIVGIYIKIK